jgi:hypothetical protein
MKNLNILLLLVTIILMAACKKTDTTAPVITLKGNNPDVVVWGSAAKYTEPGAVVTDNVDGGSLTYTVDSTVNMFLAGSYTLTYTATDAAGNKTTATRTVIVDAALYLKGFYTVKNYIGIVYDTTYTDTLSVTTTNNILKFKSFATIHNANVLATILGTTIYIPLQTDTCGIPRRPIKFSGTGSFVSDTAFNINYTITDTTSVYGGHGEYHQN